jgi:hypothetical protein
MFQYGSWEPYAGAGAGVLAAALLILAGVLIYLGSKLRRPVAVERPGRAVTILLLIMWVQALGVSSRASQTFRLVLGQQLAAQQMVGKVTVAHNPITPITALCALVAFIVIAYLGSHHGWRTALGAAIVGTMAGGLIFELPFDLIIMGRLYAPTPVNLFRLLYFLPLLLFEVSSFSLLTLSPLTRISRYTLFSLGAMFLVFAVWAVFGFSYPSSPVPIALNAVGKIVSFVAGVTLFLPQEGTATAEKRG